MDYKQQYAIIKALVSLFNTNPSKHNSLIQDILNNKDSDLLNKIFISTFSALIDPNNTITNLFDIVDLDIFEGASYTTKDWINALSVVDFFIEHVFSKELLKDTDFVVLNNVVMRSTTSNDIPGDYAAISKSLKISSNVSKDELIEKYELVHEFIFLSFTISCYKNFLLLDNDIYGEFENLLELSLFKWTSSFNGEIAEIDALLELQEACQRLEHANEINENDNIIKYTKHLNINPYGSNNFNHSVNNNSTSNKIKEDNLFSQKDASLTELSNILAEIDARNKINDKLIVKHRMLASQYAVIIENLPNITRDDDSELHNLLSALPAEFAVETTLDSLKQLEVSLNHISLILNNGLNGKQDFGPKIQELNNLLAKQTNIIKSLKQIQNEKVTQESKKQLLKQSHELEIDSYKKNILREYKKIKIFEKELLNNLVVMYKNLLKVDLRKYTGKFEEMEVAVVGMDDEINGGL
ncbi:hypothetical protein QEN19_004164 [Hanseniaspora menglaensis]